MLVKLVFIFGKIKDDKCVFLSWDKIQKVEGFQLYSKQEGSMLACYDVCILFGDIWDMYFVSSFSQNSVGVLCRIFSKRKCAGQCGVPYRLRVARWWVSYVLKRAM